MSKLYEPTYYAEYLTGTRGAYGGIIFERRHHLEQLFIFSGQPSLPQTGERERLGHPT